MKILVKTSVLKYWKPKMEIFDFYVTHNSLRYTLNKIVEQKISYSGCLAKVKIEYYDSKDNFTRNKDVDFKFNKNRKETLQEIFKKNDFIFNNQKLNSFNFINFNKKDVKILKPNLTIENVTIKNWLIFAKKIKFKIDCLFYKEVKYSLIIEKKFKIDYVFLIKKLLNYDAKNSFLRMNSYLEFEVEKFSPVIHGYKDFFAPQDYQKLFKIIDKIEIVNPQILTDKIDIFATEAVDYFNAVIIIDKTYIKNFVFKSKYNATYLQKFIAIKLVEFPFREFILGAPRNNDLKINDIYKDFKKAYFKSVLKDIGIFNLIDENVYVKMLNFNFLENSSIIEIYLNSGTITPLVRKKMQFEKTIDVALNDDFSRNNLILIKDFSILKKYPNPNLQSEDFLIQKTKKIKILEVNVANKIHIQSKWISYNFKLIKSNSDDQLKFDYIQDFYFQYSKIEYFLNTIQAEDLNIEYFEKKSDEYFYNVSLKDKLNSNHIAIRNPTELKNIIIDSKYKETDFKIICLKFDKNFIFESVIPISLFVKSLLLKSTKILHFSLKIKNRKLYSKFEFLSSKDIKITNKKLLDSYPIPILDVSDFYIRKPFLILNMTSQYNNDNMSVLCSFVIKFKNKTKLIKKEIYFEGQLRKTLSSNQYKLNLKLFNNLNKDNILVNYNKHQPDYFLKPNVSFILPSSEFYARIINWKLKSRFMKTVILNVEIKYCDLTKNIKKKIIFANKINRSNFKAWKEAAY